MESRSEKECTRNTLVETDLAPLLTDVREVLVEDRIAQVMVVHFEVHFGVHFGILGEWTGKWTTSFEHRFKPEEVPLFHKNYSASSLVVA